MIQQLLMRFAGTLNRRRAYAAAHPMVLAAESQLLETIAAVLDGRSTLIIGVAKDELLIDGEPYETKNSYARELATRLHRRGVGAITLEAGITIEELRAALGWLAADPDVAADAAPVQPGVQITRIAYDHLVLDDAIRDAECAVASLWRTLAEVAEFGVEADRADAAIGDPAEAGDGAAVDMRLGGRVSAFADTTGTESSGYDTNAIIASLSKAVGHNTSVARRTAAALMELSTHGAGAAAEGRELIGEQLLSMLERLGSSSFAPIVQSLADRALRQRFVSQTVDVLPINAAVTWLDTAANASGQQLSHQMLRIMTKLSTLADERGDQATEATFRDAAQDLVRGWELADPNPAQHVELLDRIANFERAEGVRFSSDIATASSTIESSRIVQMALELDFGGEDTVAAAEALIASGAGRQLMQWIVAAGNTSTAVWMRTVATSDKAVRQLLLSEPVDRLEARALLDILDPSSAGTLLDILGESTTRGTRLIVRQRLAEFGDAITPLLLARLEDGSWFLVRNVLTVLHETASRRQGGAPAYDVITPLLDHAQVQVRVEALRVLLFAESGTRDEAIRRALRDDNERVVVVALQALTDAAEAGTRLSAQVVSQLMSLVDAGTLSDPVRARAVRTLAFARSDAVRGWLVSLITRKTRFLRRLRLTDPTQTAVSALQVLLKNYPDDPITARVTGRGALDARWQVRDTGSSLERAT